MDEDLAKRRKIFELLAARFGRVVPANFVQNPQMGGVERIHHLIEGIYKPAWSRYALSVASMLKSPYHDEAHHNPDGSWWMHYSPKTGSMEIAANSAMIRCMTDAQPVIVLVQLSDKTSSLGARYKILGLGLVESFDHSQKLFRIRGIRAEQLSAYLDLPFDDAMLATALRLEALETWQPFLKEDRILYRVAAQRRDAAFRDVVLGNYDNTSAVTGQQFVYSTTIEADAAHIIGKASRGTDDPRNGLALSKTVHWAFDQGLFTISDQYEVIVHPNAKTARAKAFPLLATDRKRILLPTDSAYHPHQEALAWHREHRFGFFTKAN